MQTNGKKLLSLLLVFVMLLGLPILVSPSPSAREDPKFSSGFLRKGAQEIICAELLCIEDLTERLLETGR